MTIRYRRVGLKIERVPDADRARLALAQELAALEQQAADARATTLDIRRRAAALKLDLLAENRRRAAFRGARPPRSPDAPTCTAAEALAARRRVGLTQRELAAQKGWHRSSIAEAERGTRPAAAPLAAWVRDVLAADAAAPPAPGLDVAHLEALLRVPGYEEVDE